MGILVPLMGTGLYADSCGEHTSALEGSRRLCLAAAQTGGLQNGEAGLGAPGLG